MTRIPASTWAEIRTAYASGIGLREIARNMGIPAGTVLARSKREGWTQQIENAKALRVPNPEAITPMQSAAISVQERKQGLFSKALRIADKAADRMEDQIGSANISQATIAFGVSTEKALLLAGEPTHQLNVSFDAPNIIEEFAKVAAALQHAAAQLPDTAIEAEVVEPAAAAGDEVAGMGLAASRSRNKSVSGTW
jgi:hypothetical protein